MFCGAWHPLFLFQFLTLMTMYHSVCVHFVCVQPRIMILNLMVHVFVLKISPEPTGCNGILPCYIQLTSSSFVSKRSRSLHVNVLLLPPPTHTSSHVILQYVLWFCITVLLLQVCNRVHPYACICSMGPLIWVHKQDITFVMQNTHPSRQG